MWCNEIVVISSWKVIYWSFLWLLILFSNIFDKFYINLLSLREADSKSESISIKYSYYITCKRNKNLTKSNCFLFFVIKPTLYSSTVFFILSKNSPNMEPYLYKIACAIPSFIFLSSIYDPKISSEIIYKKSSKL